MRHFLLTIFFALSFVSSSFAQETPVLLWHRTPGGGNLNIDSLKQTFIITWKGPGGAPGLYHPDLGWSNFKSGVWTVVMGPARPNNGVSWGYRIDVLYANGLLHKGAETRGGGAIRFWTSVVLPEGSGQGAPIKIVEETFHINVYPLGSNLDDVDPIANEKATFKAELLNQGTDPVEMRLVVDGEQFGSSFDLDPGVPLSVDIEKEGMTRGQQGNYQWQIKDSDGNWHTVYDGGYTASGGDGPSVRLPDKLLINNNKPPDPVAPKPTPTPGPTPGPPVTNPEQGNLPGAPGGDAVPTPKDRPSLNINGGNGPNGEITEKDIYAAVKGAIEDADDGAATSGEGDGTETNQDVVEEVRGSAEEFGNRLLEAAGKGENAADKTVGKINEYLGTLGSMPTSFGARSSFTSGTFSLPNGVKLGPIVIRYADWYASLIREICLWVLRIVFFILGIKAVNYT